MPNGLIGRGLVLIKPKDIWKYIASPDLHAAALPLIWSGIQEISTSQNHIFEHAASVIIPEHAQLLSRTPTSESADRAIKQRADVVIEYRLDDAVPLDLM